MKPLTCKFVLFLLAALLIVVPVADAVNGQTISAKLLIGKKNVTEKTYSMKANDRKTLQVSSPKTITTVTYKSNNKAVATVSKKGVIRAKSVGTAIITVSVKTRQGSKKTWLKIKVRADEKAKGNQMKITVGNIELTAVLENNSSAQALKELLAEGPLTIEMSDYGNMEKVGPIGTNLPRNDTAITAGPGDIILYQGNSLTIYYDTNEWSFTRIGKITGMTREKLLNVLGDGDVTVVFSLE